MSSLTSNSNLNFQQNSNAASPIQSRAHLRRQVSNYGPGHVHNLAVIVAPTRVDYSVTKGGLRTGVVLIVFILLCSTILAVFSEDEKNRVDTKNKDFSLLEDDVVAGNEEILDEITVLNLDDNEDDIKRNENMEEIMLAKLKEKAELQQQKQQQQHQMQYTKLKTVTKTSRTKKSKKDNDDDVIDVIDVKAEIENNDNQEVDDNDDDFEKNNRNEKKKKITVQTKSKKTEKNKSEIKPKVNELNKDKIKVKNNVKEEEDNNDENNEINELLDKRIKKAAKRLKRAKDAGNNPLKSWHNSSIQAQKMADDLKNPRKMLLKLKKRKALTKTNDEKDDVDDKDDDENEEEEKEEEEEEELSKHNSKANKNTNNPFPVINELVAVRKKTVNYDRRAITNRDDYKFRNQLDDADFRLEKHDFVGALKLYDEVLQRNKHSPRAQYGQARVYQLQSEFADDVSSGDADVDAERSLIENAISGYKQVIDNNDTPDELFRLAADNLIECARWLSNLHKVLTIQRALIDKFPERLSLQTNFAITFLQMGRVEDARKIFVNVLEIDKVNAIAEAYYGYILKVYDNKLEQGVSWMRKGLRSSQGSIDDPKFFFHLGDALTRLGRTNEAMKIYEEGVFLGLFPSIFQRSMHNLEGLVAKPWWTVDQSGCAKQLKQIERQWTIIRKEALNAWEDHRLSFENEENETDGVQMTIYLRKNSKFTINDCQTIFPSTCEILKIFAKESKCAKDQMKIMVLLAGSRIWPRCAPTNYELEAQLGLVTPSEARIRVGQETRGWKAGRFLVFDKSFEHEVWFDGAAAKALRVIMTFDLWHPQVPQAFHHSN